MIEVIIAILSLGVGDYTDPLDLNTEDKNKQVLTQQACESTTTTNSSGETTTIKSCKTMETINKNEGLR